MIEYKTGDILKENAEALVNTVNCVGVMGRGIALQFKKTFPDNFKAYAEACKREELLPGRLFIFKTQSMINPRYIINFPTKRHWRGKSRIEDIESGLNNLAKIIQKYNINSIAIPPLGSGLGGLDWQVVKPKIVNALQEIEGVRVVVFEPIKSQEAEKMARCRNVPQMTPGRAALVSLMHRYLNGLLDPFITLLEVHKLMYFLQESGEPLRLQFQKGHYGPYAENLRHVLNIIEGHLVSGYGDGGDAPKKQLQIVPGAIHDADKFLKNYPETIARFDRVSNLVEGFESSMGMELLSSVYWVVKHQSVRSEDDLVRQVHAWNERKQKFTPRQINIAYKTLHDKGWIADQD